MLFILVLLSGITACGNNNEAMEKEEASSVENNGSEKIVLDDYYFLSDLRGYFTDGNFIKVEVWQRIDGVESSGWFSMYVSQSDTEIKLETEGELKGKDISETIVPSEKYTKALNDIHFNGRLDNMIIGEILSIHSHPFTEIRDIYWNEMLDEYFGYATV